MSTSSRLLVMKPSTSAAVTGSASVSSSTGARPKKRSQSRRIEKTIILDSDDTNSPSTSQTAAALSVSENRRSGPKSQSRRKSSSIRSNSGYNNNMRRSSTASTSTGGSPKKRVKKKGKSLKQKLRETVLDESADWRQRFRQTEEKNRKLAERLMMKKQAIISQQDQNRREIKGLNETYNAKVSQDRERNFKEKSKIEKELKSMTRRAEKAELELIKAESVKSVQSGPGEALFQDVLGNLKEFLDGQLQCSICNEIFVYSSVISCGHTFCEDCIEGWKKKQPNTTCPICRSDIIMTSPNQVMDSFIEKFIDNFFPDDAKKARAELIADRKAKKEQREANRKREPVLSSGTRRRILNLESDDDDDDSWDGFGFRLALPPDSPSRYSTPSSVASFLSRNSGDMLSTPNGSDIEYNFSSDSDSDDSYQPGQDIDDVDLSLLDAITHDLAPSLAPSFNVDVEDSDVEHFSHDDEEDGEENNAVANNTDTDADERAVTPNDTTDEDTSSDDEDDVNEISFEFRGNPGWLAFSDSD